jgi:hypothetical protein
MTNSRVMHKTAVLLLIAGWLDRKQLSICETWYAKSPEGLVLAVLLA